MNIFKMILSFFSTIPVKNYEFIESDLGKGIRLLPLVGLLFGMLIGSIKILLSGFIDNESIAFFLLLIYVFLTGGLHLDGVADTCDGIFSHRSKERILEIMKDSRIGSFGVLSLIILLLGDWLFLSKSSLFVIFLFPMIGRLIALFTCRISTYARENGFGSEFIKEAKTMKSLIVIISITLIISFSAILFHQIQIILSLIITFLLLYWIIRRINRKLEGITGDIIGFSIELSQLVFLMFTLIGGKYL